MARDLESQLAAVERIAQVLGLFLAQRRTGSLLAPQKEVVIYDSVCTSGDMHERATCNPMLSSPSQ